jgi:hypothetical protein
MSFQTVGHWRECFREASLKRIRDVVQLLMRRSIQPGRALFVLARCEWKRVYEQKKDQEAVDGEDRSKSQDCPAIY